MCRLAACLVRRYLHFHFMPFLHSSTTSLAPSPVRLSRERFSLASCPQADSADAETVLNTLLMQFSAADFDPDQVIFPEQTDGVYTDLAIAEYRLRVYAMVHSSADVSSLFLILGPLAGSYLPMGSRLSVREQNLLLSEPRLHWAQRSTYVHTQVFGNWEEKFTIEIVLPNARPKVLAPLALADSRSLAPMMNPMAA